MFGKGYLGVDFFLMLSGFLMTRTQEWRFTGVAAAWQFMTARIGRLWPMMALGGLIGAPVLFYRTGDLGHFLSLAIPNLLLLPASFMNVSYPLNIPAWTIFYELVANALHTLVFWRLKRWALAVSLLVSLAATIAVGMHWGSLDVGARPAHFLAGFPRIVFAYLLGMVLGRWWRDEPVVPVPVLPALTAMPVLFAAAWYFGWTGWIFDIVFVVLACPLIIAGGMRLQGAPRWALWSGMLSFPLFAVHMPVLQTSYELGLNYLLGGALALAAGIVATLATNWPRRRAAKNGEVPA